MSFNSKYSSRLSDGVIEQAVNTYDASRLCISSNNAIRLAKLGAALERSFKSPRDIEFALSKVDDVILILQSRPITTLHTWTDDDLLHEFDHGVASNEDSFTTANVG